MPGIYVHIPFCLKKCAYCAFVSQSGRETIYQDYVTALCRDLSGRGGLPASVAVSTVFFGGGTPTVLSVQSLEQILRAVRFSFEVSADAEISLEANPGTVSAADLSRLRHIGFNRISFGVQSFDDSVLANAGRVHNCRDALEAVAMARSAGFRNISLDLMYGLPGQTIDSWRESCETAVLAGVAHISAYGLKVEEGTPLAAMLEAGEIKLPDEDTEEAMYDFVTVFLPANGYLRYEISNYSKPGYECRHNLGYWQYKPYAGFGAAAHSFLAGERRSNVDDSDSYIQLMKQSESPVAFREKTDVRTQMAEFIFLGLRTSAGILTVDFSSLFGCDFDVVFGAVTGKLEQEGLVELFPGGIRLTGRGMKLSNQVFAKFLPA